MLKKEKGGVDIFTYNSIKVNRKHLFCWFFGILGVKLYNQIFISKIGPFFIDCFSPFSVSSVLEYKAVTRKMTINSWKSDHTRSNFNFLKICSKLILFRSTTTNMLKRKYFCIKHIKSNSIEKVIDLKKLDNKCRTCKVLNQQQIFKVCQTMEKLKHY